MRPTLEAVAINCPHILNGYPVVGHLSFVARSEGYRSGSVVLCHREGDHLPWVVATVYCTQTGALSPVVYDTGWHQGDYIASEAEAVAAFLARYEKERR